MKKLFKLGVALAAFCFADSALACPDPNWRPFQSIGTIALGADRSQSPVNVTAGGTRDLSQCAFLGPRATGVTTVGAAIRFRLNNRRRERLYLEASGVNCDLVMVMNDARGRWYFADDSRQTSVDLSLGQAPSGVYNLWFGVTGPSACPTTVRIRLGEGRGYGGGGGAVGGGATGGGGGSGSVGQTAPCPEPGLNPRNLMGSLSYADTATGVRYALPRSGGRANLSTCQFPGISASGFSTYTPSFMFVWRDPGTSDVELWTRGACDTVLLIRTPNGFWGFNDNRSSTSARITIPSAAPGRYSVWIGTARQGETCRVELNLRSSR